MSWPEGVLGRALAGTYLAGWVTWLIGVVWTLIGQLTGGSESAAGVIAGVLFFAGALGVTAVAIRLRNHVSKPAGRFTASATGYQRAWNRLMLGMELRAAVRVLKS
jgi:hypothetical protein